MIILISVLYIFLNVIYTQQFGMDIKTADFNLYVVVPLHFMSGTYTKHQILEIRHIIDFF